jgi:hypothetical protein
VAQTLITDEDVIGNNCSGVDARLSGLAVDGRDKRNDDRDDDSDEAPETPLDEPRPPRVQDPPPQPDTKGPYVVQSSNVLTS